MLGPRRISDISRLSSSDEMAPADRHRLCHIVFTSYPSEPTRPESPTVFTTFSVISSVQVIQLIQKYESKVSINIRQASILSDVFDGVKIRQKGGGHGISRKIQEIMWLFVFHNPNIFYSKIRNSMRVCFSAEQNTTKLRLYCNYFLPIFALHFRKFLALDFFVNWEYLQVVRRGKSTFIN